MEFLTLSQFISSKFNNYCEIINVAKDCNHFQVNIEDNSTSCWESKDDNKFLVVSFFLENAFYTVTYTYNRKLLVALNIRIVMSDYSF